MTLTDQQRKLLEWKRDHGNNLKMVRSIAQTTRELVELGLLDECGALNDAGRKAIEGQNLLDIPKGEVATKS